MTRCGLCMKWFHADCCDNPEDVKYSNKGAWTCPSCRGMPERLARMQLTIDSLVVMLQALTTEATDDDDSEADEDESQVNMNNSHLEDSGAEEFENEEEEQPFTYCTPIVHVQNAFSVLAEQDAEADSWDAGAAQETLLNEKAQIHKHKKAAASTTILTVASDEAEVTEEILSDQDVMLELMAHEHRKTQLAAKSSDPKLNVTILSDSVLKKVDSKRTEALCSEANCQFTLVPHTYTIGEAVSRIQSPSKRKLPTHLQSTQCTNINPDDPIVIHTGTNHIEKESAKTTTHRLERLEYNLQRRGYKKVALSSIVYRRTDNIFESSKIATLNNVILTICTRNGWTYIDNDNVDDACITHADKVHPNDYGVERLTHNIATAVKQLILRPHH